MAAIPQARDLVNSTLVSHISTAYTQDGRGYVGTHSRPSSVTQINRKKLKRERMELGPQRSKESHVLMNFHNGGADENDGDGRPSRAADWR